MSSGESGNGLWFLNPPEQDADHGNRPQSYHSTNTTNPFNKVTHSPPPQYPPPQGSPYPQQQEEQFTPPQFPPLQETPYPQPQGSPYPQQALFPPPQQQGLYSLQQGYPQNQGSPYPQQGYTDSQASGEASSFYGFDPPSAIQPGQDPGGPGKTGLFDNAMQMAGVQQPPPGPDGFQRGWFSSSKNPLDPPPNMFRRPPPGHYSYNTFRPMSVLAVSDRLQDGFALIPPATSPGDPHPFMSHDITEEDWHRFLEDFQKTAHLSPSDRLFQGVANSFINDKVSSPKVQKRMAENKLEPICDYLMAWNHHFFRPRRITVVLAKGNHRFSGETDDYPPDIGRHSKKASKEKKSSHKSRSTGVPLVTAAIPGELSPRDLLGTQPRSLPKPKGRAHSDSEDSDSDSSSSSSSSESDDHGFKGKRGHTERKAERGRRREERREERRARKEERRAGREERRGKHGKVKQSAVAAEVPATRFRLVVCYWDGREVY